MEIDFFFDTICPWCYIGKRRLEQTLLDYKQRNINVNWCSFLLNPDLPASGVDRNRYLARKFGSESRIKRIYGNIAKVGRSVNIGFNFNTIRQTPNSINAHRFIHYAKAYGKSETALDSLFKNYFVTGKDIGDINVLSFIAKKIGLDKNNVIAHLESKDGLTEIYEANNRAHNIGVNGVPSFIFNGHLVISGAQEPAVLKKMLDAAFSIEKIS